MLNSAPPIIAAFQQSNPAQVIASFWDTLELRTNVTPPIRLNTAELFDTTTPAGPVVKFLKPTVVFTGAAGRQVLAPGGEAGDGSARARRAR